jgi:alginate O-acetyltransferase complex protein AlgI
MYGFLILLEKLWLGQYLAKYRLLSHSFVLLITLVGFVIFHADGLSGMQQDLSALFGLSGLPLYTEETLYYLKSYGLVLMIAVVGATPLAKKFSEKGEGLAVMTVLEPLTISALLLAVTAYLVDGSFNPFLYFRF